MNTIITEEMMRGETSEEIEIDNNNWEALIETSESQYLLKNLAGEALKELREGTTKSMSFNDDGQIVGN